ncbi:MAG TPA: hypothetical protein DCK99_18105 [Blastocatellia bacterium]|nr:hypothetical protein [Blastocatellia bacterium]
MTNCELANRWSVVRLDEACEVILGQSPPGESYNTEGKGLPFFQGKAEFGDLYPAPVKWCTKPSKVAQKDDVLISVRAPVGPTNLCPGDACIGRGLAALRPRNGIPPRYVLYALRNNVHSLVEQATGSTFEAISGKQLRGHTIPLAPSDEQQRVVAEIEKQFTRLEAGMASLNRVQVALKRYRASVLKGACEGRLVLTEAELTRKENRSYESADALLQRILKERREKWNSKGKYKEPVKRDTSSFPQLPEGWTWTTVEQLTKDSMIGLDRGRAQQRDDENAGVPYIKMNNVTMDGRVVFDRVTYVPATDAEAKRFVVREDDILFNTRNSKELVGKVGLVRKPPKGAIYNNNLMRLRFADGVIPSFLNLQMCSHDFRSRMELIKKATTNVAAVYAKDLFPLPIALPPLAEQQRIVAEVERRMSMIEELETMAAADLQRAGRLRQSILQKAFLGRL